MKPAFVVCVLAATAAVCLAELYSPCDGKSVLNGACAFDDDCTGAGVHCLRGACRCIGAYAPVQKTDSDGVTYSVCEKLPVKNERCPDNQCLPPLTCQNGRCKCLSRGNTDVDDDGVCVKDTPHNATCDEHADCNRPFMACINKRCGCISGTGRDSRGNCVARAQCPFGTTVGKACTRKSSDRADYENTLNLKSDDYGLDSCAVGEFCYTPDDTPSGRCCEATCPLGTTPTSQSCADCNDDRHFCHTVSGNTFAFSVCCERPCGLDGTDQVYVDGKCMQAAALGDKCTANGQCGGGVTMMCANGTCQCKSGHRPARDARLSTTSPYNVAQTCEIECPTGFARENKCLERVGLFTSCQIQEQCPTNSGCYRGRCMCKCGFLAISGRCEPKPTPAPTTAAPSAAGGLAGLLTGSGTGSSSSGGNLAGKFGELVGLLGQGGNGGSSASGLLGNIFKGQGLGK